MYPVLTSSWHCSLDTRDIPTSVSDSSEANPRVWPVGVIALPTPTYQPDGAHTAPGHSYGQGYAEAAIWGSASSTDYLLSQASPASRRLHFGLKHFPLSSWLAAGGDVLGYSETRPSRTWLQVAPPHSSFAKGERSPVGEATFPREKTPWSKWNFQATDKLSLVLPVGFHSLTVMFHQFSVKGFSGWQRKWQEESTTNLCHSVKNLFKLVPVKNEGEEWVLFSHMDFSTEDLMILGVRLSQNRHILIFVVAIQSYKIVHFIRLDQRSRICVPAVKSRT